MRSIESGRRAYWPVLITVFLGFASFSSVAGASFFPSASELKRTQQHQLEKSLGVSLGQFPGVARAKVYIRDDGEKDGRVGVGVMVWSSGQQPVAVKQIRMAVVSSVPHADPARVHVELLGVHNGDGSMETPIIGDWVIVLIVVLGLIGALLVGIGWGRWLERRKDRARQ